MKPWGRALAELGYAVEVPAAAGPRHPLAGPQPGRLDRLVRRGRAAAFDRLRADLRRGRGRRPVDGRRRSCCGWPRSAATRSPGIVLVNPFVSSDRKELVALPVLKHVVPALKGVGQRHQEARPGRGAATPSSRSRASRRCWRCGSSWSPDLGRVTQPLLYFRSDRRPRDRRLVVARPCSSTVSSTRRRGADARATATTSPPSTTTPTGSSRSPRSSSPGSPPPPGRPPDSPF